MEVAPDLFVNPFLLAGIGLAIGLMSGFVGVGGGYMLTPTLVILGFPANIAVGTGLALIAGNSLIAVVRHRQMGHVDLKMGAIMMAGTIGGTEIGVRILDSLHVYGPETLDIIVMSVLVVALAGIGIFMYRELRLSRQALCDMTDEEREACEDVQTSHLCEIFQNIRIFPHIRFTKSKLRISGWIVLLVGFATGILSGFIGVGGGFVRAPALIYIIGQSSVMAVGTDLLGIVFSGSFGCFRHAMLGNVNLAVALVMLMGTAVGTQAGALGTVYLKGIAVRYVLGYSVLTALFGPLLKLAYFLTGRDISWLNQASVAVTMLQIFFPVTVIIALLILAMRYQRGEPVPAWAEPLMLPRS